MANGGEVGRNPTHIYCNVALLLLHTLQCCSLQFNIANYISYDFHEWDIKGWYLYGNHCYKTFVKFILGPPQKRGGGCSNGTFILKEYLILPCNSTKLPSFLQVRLIGRSPRA
jgi:hypothetical protein